MKNNGSDKILSVFLYFILFLITAPVALLFVWVFVSRWPWPNILPKSYSLRAIKELSAPHNMIFSILFSSISLSLAVAILSAIIALLTSRALIFYDFKGKSIIEFLTIAPFLIPAAVFAMGIHVVFIKMSLADTAAGVIIVHIIYTLPYSINIMKDLTETIGKKMELQAMTLGASPIKSFMYVSLPLLIPGIKASITMAYISSFSQYFLTILIGGGNVKTISTIMVPFIAKGDRSLGSGYALVFILSTFLIFKIVDATMKNLPYKNRKDEI